MNRLTFSVAAVLSSSSLLLIDSTIKGAAMLLLAGCAAVLLRRDSAATRHLVWLVAIVAVLVVPMCSALLPQWRVLPEWAVISPESVEQVSLPAADKEASTTPESDKGIQGESSLVAADSNAFPVISTDQSASAPSGVAEAATFPKNEPVVAGGMPHLAQSDNPVDVAAVGPSSFRWQAALSLVWLCGIGVLTLRLLAARLMLWSSERRGTVIADSRTLPVAKVSENSDAATSSKLVAGFSTAVRQLEVSQPVSLIIQAERSIPIVWGLRKSRLLLPEVARYWTTEQQNSVLLHELAHIKRRDTWTQLLAQIACAVYWFNPLVWFAAWRLHVERERACDDLVLSNGVVASAYAEHLLNVATRLASSPWTQACGLAMARRSSLEGRLTAVLSRQRNRRRATNAIVIVSLLIGATIAVPLAMLRAAETVEQAENPSDQQQAEDMPDKEGVAENQEDAPGGEEAMPAEPVASASEPLPKHEKAVNLLQRWQRIEDRETPLKNSTVIRIRKAIDSWIRQSPVKPEADEVLALRDWELDRDEHPVADVVAWLDRIASINPQPIQFAINGEKRVSRELTVEERNVLKFGPIAENGLRAAWDYSPVKDVYKIGDVLKTTLVLQNTTENILEFGCGYSLSNNVRWIVTGDGKRKVEVDETSLRGSVPFVTFHVKPGQVAEIMGYGGVTIGDIEPRPLPRLKARADERITVRWDVRKPVEMTTGTVSFKVAAMDHNPAQPDRQVASKLPAATEKILQWGKPVNGLRAALSRLPSLGKPLRGQVWDFNLVVQNVSDAPLRFIGNEASPNIRRVTLRRDGDTLFRLISEEPSNVDVILQPRETLAFPLITPDDAKGRSMAENPVFTFLSMMKVEQAPIGAWSGELRTPEVSGAVISGKQSSPQDDAESAELKPAAGEKLSSEFEQKLKWGKTINGLRSAMMIRDTPEVLNELFIVVQNVSQAPIHIDDSAGQNAHTLILRFDSILESVMSGKESGFGNVLLKPGEVVVAPAMPLGGKKIDGMTVGSVMVANLFHDPSMSYNAEVKFEDVPAGTWKGTLTTANSTGLDAAPPSLQFGMEIDAAAEQQMLWGEPSNGLRAALTIRNSPDDPNTPDLFLAVQNVKTVPVRLNDLVAARGQRLLTIFREESAQAQTRIDQPTMANVLLRPREVAFLLMAPKLVPDNTSEHSKGQLMARGMLKEPKMMLMGEMTIANARPGGWTGKLVTRITGAAAKGDAIPKSKTAQALFKQWKANARLNGKIPGGQLRLLAKATSNFVGYNKEDERAPKLAELLKRMDVTRDWTQQEAVDLLNDVTDVYDNLPTWANDISRFSISDVITTGKPLPDELKHAPWGEAHDSGLRTAWLLDSAAEQHQLNTPLKSRILYQNNGTDTVVFRVVSWNQSGSHQAHDADGEKIETVSTSWTTIGQVKAVRLAPGEFTEVIGAGIGVGANMDGEVWRNTRVGTWIHAKAGDEVTFTPDAVTISGNDGRRQEVKDSEWWVTFISQRLKRDAPLPNDNPERTRILDRVVQDLFGTSPTEDEIKTLLADKSPDVVTSLAQRLAERKGTTSVYGELQSGPTTFRVLHIDSEAKNRPHLAIGPGRYKFDNNTTLVIVGRGNLMDAKLEFTGNESADPFPIKLSNSRGDWAIAWKRDMTTFWIADQGVLRSVDFSDPKQVLEITIGADDRLSGPKYFLDALQPTLKKNAPPAAAAAPPAASPKDD